jgi:hypothetical protein
MNRGNEICRDSAVPTKNSESGEKSRVLRFTAMTPPAFGSSEGPASWPGKIGESLVNRADLSLLKTLFAPRQLSVGTSSPAPQAMRGRLDLRRNSGRTKF